MKKEIIYLPVSAVIMVGGVQAFQMAGWELQLEDRSAKNGVKMNTWEYKILHWRMAKYASRQRRVEVL